MGSSTADCRLPTAALSPHLRAAIHEPHRSFQNAEDALQVGTAPRAQSGRRHDAVGPLLVSEPRILFYTVERPLARTAEYREHSLAALEVDGVIAPLARRDFAAVDGENLPELPA